MLFKKNFLLNVRTFDSRLAIRKYVKVFVVTLIFVLLVFGCSMNEDDHEDTGFVPVGEWSDGFGTGYKITVSSIEYFSPDFGEEFPAQNFTGSIEKAIDFSDDTGVLIIKILTSENINLTTGKYTCVYYKDYKANQVNLANPIGPAPDYETVETDTLDQAITLFSAGNMSTHVEFWGSGYTK